MNKYCIYDKNGEYEVWKYIDDIDEARQYWYVDNYLDKYGEQEMPLCMNKNGGFHSCQKQYVKCFIEAEDFPSLASHRDLFASQIINTPDFNCGWIDPCGNTYKNEYYEHLARAFELVEMNYKIEWTRARYNEVRYGGAPDDFLMKRGWVKVNASAPYFVYDDEKLTDEAAQVMLKLMERRDNYGTLD